MAVREGKLDEAVAQLEQAVQREPEVAEYRSNLGAALLEKLKAGDASVGKRALEQLELAVQWGATLPDVYANLSFARLAAGDANGALAAADVAVRLDEKHVPSLYNRAAALNALNQLTPCLDTLDTILKLSPGFPPALQSRANTLKKMGRA
jgi:tetratricopeptide (TPR) repeat protein